MTGPEHYREAERLLDSRHDIDRTGLLAEAQVHATLALTAATIGPIMSGWQGDAGGWFETIAGDPR